MDPYIPNKYPATPQRKHIIDCKDMEGQTVPEIHRDTNVPTPTIRRTLKSGVTRHNKYPTSRTPKKISARDLQSLVRAVTSSPDGR